MYTRVWSLTTKVAWLLRKYTTTVVERYWEFYFLFLSLFLLNQRYRNEQKQQHKENRRPTIFFCFFNLWIKMSFNLLLFIISSYLYLYYLLLSFIIFFYLFLSFFPILYCGNLTWSQTHTDEKYTVVHLVNKTIN